MMTVFRALHYRGVCDNNQSPTENLRIYWECTRHQVQTNAQDQMTMAVVVTAVDLNEAEMLYTKVRRRTTSPSSPVIHKFVAVRLKPAV